MNTENPKIQKFDYYVVVLPVEFLPGMKSTANASLEFSDEDVARKSLEYVQKQYPEARLTGHKWLDLDDELKVWRGQIQKRTDAMRKQLNESKERVAV